MIIKSISITEGKKSKQYAFSAGSNLIYSQGNTAGKTTLLRIILYSLGYSIPNTKNIKFENCKIETVVNSNGKTYTILREDEYLLVNENSKETYYILPEELNNFHQELFGTTNFDVLNNLLGVYYMDQEKGWTLLNRGVVIGKIRFNIQQLILGLSERNYAKLQAEFLFLEREISKYQHMQNVAQYQQEIFTEKGDIIHEKYDDSLQRDLAVCSFDLESLNKELHQVNEVINDNNKISKFIEKMSLRVKGPNGTEIPVNKNTIIGLPDNINFMLSRRKLLVTQISKLNGKLTKIRDLIYYQSQQPTTESLVQAFDKNISAISIDAKAVDNILSELSTQRIGVKKALNELTKADNPVLLQMYEKVMKYGEELGLTPYMSSSVDFLFTSNLKELTGATLMKMVFAFKMAYISAVESVLKIKLPIILDSPSGKELGLANIQLLMDILDRDFLEHQIIIASIFTYNLRNLNIIELTGKITE
ncbi:hypothetical protein [uncultured Oscillibacter sp.]|uniref:hypothetical protein n=1 Tax=uncultured Oscillibacter sp. TaxID=876091 RepID=UPI0025EC235F|nr:hypothetical protein [uncultured Oscillibacter sp.]